MQVKKFEAPTIQEALDHIKRELGPEAIILQTKKNKKGFGLMSKSSVEITAAVSEKAINKKKIAETKLPPADREAVQKLSADRQADIYEKFSAQTKERVQLSQDKPQQKPEKKLTATRYIEIGTPPMSQAAPTPVLPGRTIEDEVRHLKQIVAEMKSSDLGGPLGAGSQALLKNSEFLSPALQDTFDHLVINGVDKRFALGLIKKVAFELGSEKFSDPDLILDRVAEEIMGSIEVMSLLNFEPGTSGSNVIAFVGPTGVGKTTTIAKIAGEAVLKHKLKVGLINVDCYKVAAADQLSTYAKILNVPFRTVHDAQELDLAIRDFSQYDLVLVDTSGRSQRDTSSLKEMELLLHSVPHMRTELVLSATTRDAELYDMGRRFAVFRPEGLILSKLDEAMTHGTLFNTSHRLKLPLAYFTTGQRVPEDLEEVTRERVAALVMDL